MPSNSRVDFYKPERAQALSKMLVNALAGMLDKPEVRRKANQTKESIFSQNFFSIRIDMV